MAEPVSLKIEYFLNLIKERDQRIMDLEISNAYLADRVKDLEAAAESTGASKEKKMEMTRAMMKDQGLTMKEGK